jgi:tRNA(His) guanylyltransferase
MDDLGDRLKSYESQETARKLMPGVPVYARIDGRSFSRFTRNMARPFDTRMTAAMVHALSHVLEESGATIGYTASDEISLGWALTDHTQELWFGGKIHKLTSVLASITTVAFVQGIQRNFENSQELLDRMPHFDCRVFQVPNLHELANCFLWRNLDATKNAISQAAHHYYNHAELQGKNSSQKQEMLFQKGINFNDLPDSFKRGVFVRKQTVAEPFDAQAWASIPIQHRPNLDSLLMRSKIISFDLPPLNRVKNRVDCLFHAQEPQEKIDT